MAKYKYLEETAPGRFRVRMIRQGLLRSSPTMSLEAALQARDRMLAQFEAEETSDDQPQITGVTVEELNSEEYEEAVYTRAVEAYNRESVRQVREDNQVIKFPADDYSAVAFVGDTHIGSSGTDYERLFSEMAAIAGEDNVWVWLMGDVVDSFIVKSLQWVRFEAPMTIHDEWLLLRRFLRIIGKKIIGVNDTPDHDGWVEKVAGVPYFRDVLTDFAPKALYGKHRVKVTFSFGDWDVQLKMRHKWRGYSQWNPTHAIEKAGLFDKDFDIGVGAHTHQGAFIREFAVGGRECLAVQVGPYKRYDHYAEELGLPPHNDGTAMLIIFDPFDRTFTGYSNIEHGLKVLRGLRVNASDRKDNRRTPQD